MSKDNNFIGNMPVRLLRMYRRHGKTPGKKCKTCAHLKRYEYGHTYYKCVLYGLSASSATDWRLKWDACGKWEEVKDDKVA